MEVDWRAVADTVLLRERVAMEEMVAAAVPEAATDAVWEDFTVTEPVFKLEGVPVCVVECECVGKIEVL